MRIIANFVLLFVISVYKHRHANCCQYCPNVCVFQCKERAMSIVASIELAFVISV